MNLTTLAKIKEHLGIPTTDISKDAKLKTIIEGVSEYFEGQTSRKFEAQTHALKLSGDGLDSLCLPQYPVLVDDGEPMISALEIDGVNVMAEIQSGDIDVDAKTGILYRADGWTVGRRNIEITYAAGYARESDLESGLEAADDLPKDLVLAATRFAARLYERSTAEGVASAAPGSFSVTFKDGVDDDIKQTIGLHSRARIG